jgi:hypothetical protein
LQVSEEIYLACTSGGLRLDPADAFVVNGAAWLDLAMHSASAAGGNTVMALPIKLPAGVSFIYGTAGWEQLGLRDSFLRISR